MSTKSKGDRIERKAKKELEDKGYLVEKKIKSRFLPKDFFDGRFDLEIFIYQN